MYERLGWTFDLEGCSSKQITFIVTESVDKKIIICELFC